MWEAIGNIPKSSERAITEEHIQKTNAVFNEQYGDDFSKFNFKEESEKFEGNINQYDFIDSLEIPDFMVYRILGESDYIVYKLQKYIELQGHDPNVTFKVYKRKDDN